MDLVLFKPKFTDCSRRLKRRIFRSTRSTHCSNVSLPSYNLCFHYNRIPSNTDALVDATLKKPVVTLEKIVHSRLEQYKNRYSAYYQGELQGA